MGMLFWGLIPTSIVVPDGVGAGIILSCGGLGRLAMLRSVCGYHSTWTPTRDTHTSLLAYLGKAVILLAPIILTNLYLGM